MNASTCSLWTDLCHGDLLLKIKRKMIELHSNVIDKSRPLKMASRVKTRSSEVSGVSPSCSKKGNGSSSGQPGTSQERDPSVDIVHKVLERILDRLSAAMDEAVDRLVQMCYYLNEHGFSSTNRCPGSEISMAPRCRPTWAATLRLRWVKLDDMHSKSGLAFATFSCSSRARSQLRPIGRTWKGSWGTTCTHRCRSMQEAWRGRICIWPAGSPTAWPPFSGQKPSIPIKISPSPGQNNQQTNKSKNSDPRTNKIEPGSTPHRLFQRGSDERRASQKKDSRTSVQRDPQEKCQMPPRSRKYRDQQLHDLWSQWSSGSSELKSIIVVVSDYASSCPTVLHPGCRSNSLPIGVPFERFSCQTKRYFDRFLSLGQWTHGITGTDPWPLLKISQFNIRSVIGKFHDIEQMILGSRLDTIFSFSETWVWTWR